MNDKIKISACIVVYNNGFAVLNTIKSILEHTKDVELSLYICDNKSTDNTVDIISRAFPDIEIIKCDRNLGFGFGHNTMLPLIKSDYHFVINPDIVLNSNALLEIVKKFEDDNDVVMATVKILNKDGSEQHLPKKNPKLKYLIGGRFERFGSIFKKYRDDYTLRNVIITKPIDIDFCTGCFFGIRTEVFKKLDGFDDRFFMYFEDADLTRRAKKFGRVVFYPDIAVTHIWERASSKKIKFFIIQIVSMFKYFIKWFGKE